MEIPDKNMGVDLINRAALGLPTEEEVTIPSGLILIDKEIISNPVNKLVYQGLNKLLNVLKNESDKVYNYANSTDFKQAKTINQNKMLMLETNVIFKLQDTIQRIIDKFRLLNMKGGFKSFFRNLFKTQQNNPTGNQPLISNSTPEMDRLLVVFEDQIESQYLKFNGLFNTIKMYVNYVQSGNSDKTTMIYNLIIEKLKTFMSLSNDIMNSISAYNDVPSRDKIFGGNRRKTVRHRDRSTRVKRSTRVNRSSRVKRSTRVKRRL
jgi:hypothetical protein